MEAESHSDNDEYTSEEEEEHVAEPKSSTEDLLTQEISSMPLSKVRALKAKLGVKLFNKMYLNETAPKSENVEDSDDDAAPEEFKRDGKNRPREISTKKALKHNSIISTKRQKRYDPRFECGDFDEVRFSRDYGFINQMKRDEVSKMKKMLKKGEIGEAETSDVKEVIKVMENQIRTAEDKSDEIETRAELRKTNIDRLRSGKKPIFLNKNQLKTKVIEKRFDRLKKTGKAKTYVMKKKTKAFKKGVDVE
ncbi:unnamed protein product [Bursaphelenchus okinawaensis]|uniref:rRNA biogenesis protein RRP36 n=1 Tax=Bursaphelenchus okinawaensis TaxID=465554 RepID=A0A811L916_9BILA|nr:unnamed protein product [Bursaphelenchus okinawaensis]CAG9119749.1 unnamed protein product [Bursaphelenchus okinawaensis]